MPYILSVIFNILTSGLPCCLLALGIYLTFRILDFADLTAEGSLLIGGSFAIALIKIGVNPFVATLVATIGGGLCGYLTSVFYTKLRIPKILCGIITMTATSSIALLILGLTDGTQSFINIVSLDSSNQTVFSIFYFCDPIYRPLIKAGVMLAFVILIFVIIYFFFGTEYGIAIRATGINEKMSRAQGINTKRASIVALIISNALIGLAGALICQSNRGCSVGYSTGYLVVGLASIIIGETIFGNKSFRRSLIAISIGAIIYFVIINVAIELGLNGNLLNLLYAVLIVFALSLPLIKQGIFYLVKERREKHA